jgi:nitrite reductase (NADH) small subunit
VAAVVVARLAELAVARGRSVRVGARELAVWRLADGRVQVLDNTCLHLGGPLAEGLVHDGCVVCPWHGWTYDLRTGRRRTPLGEASGVAVYPAWVDGGDVWVDLPPD